ncbi:AraC family transcriptional regulator [Massilia niabensis]|uniref:AraC family transcriptional regulator n=1 Tax=Massilia niabensis TaxID=544910 RepID=A0ABW0L0S9_9BURK
MHTLRESIEHAQLYQHCVFHSNEKVASHCHVAEALADHDVQWQRGAPDTALFTARINRLQLFVLRYGAQVQITPTGFNDFALVHMSLKGTAEFECDGQRVYLPEGQAAIVAPRKSIRLWWEEGSEQLILKVPHVLVRELQPPGVGRNASPVLQSGLMGANTPDSQWNLLLQSLLQILAQPGEQRPHQAWIDHFERNITMFLMHQQGGLGRLPVPSAGTLAAIDSGQGLVAASACDRMDALERYMRAKLSAPVSLVDLALAAGVSVRTLNMLCHRHHGVPPMDLLRNMRLDAAQAVLQARPDASVTETALEFGFGHLGRFSAYYRERFGVLPKHTALLAH